MTKIDIISGFLGAGKTTLIQKLIRECYAGEKIVLIENEFGEIGIDGGFLKDAGINVREMNSGCICCSLVGDFSRSLRQVLDEYAPERIVIEPSGVGKLSDVIRAVKDTKAEEISLNSFTVVVDANKCKMYMKNFGEFFNDQIENAGCVVFSHTDKASEEKLSEAVALVREHNAASTFVTTPIKELSAEELLSAMEKRVTIEDELEMMAAETCSVCGHDHHEHEHHHHHDEHEHHEHHHDCDCGCHEYEHRHEHEHHHHHGEHEHHHHHHADEVFSSFGRETVRKYTAQELRGMLEALSDAVAYGIILRAKGILPAVDGSWLHFDYVPGEVDVRVGSAAPIGKLCVIGTKLDVDALTELFSL